VRPVDVDALVDAQRRRIERMLDIHRRFQRSVLAGGGPADIAAAAHDILGCTVVVVDTDDQPIVVVPPASAGGPDPADVVARVHAGLGTRRPIQAGGHDYGFIVALTNGEGLDEDGVIALERAAMAVAMRLAQSTAVAAAEERFAALSLEELISGHTTSAAEIAERAATFGWDLHRPRAVLLASIDPPVSDADLLGPLATIAAAARATLGREAIVWTRTATIAALLAPDTDDPTERRQLAEGLRHELNERVRSVTVSIGVGRRVDSAANLSRSFAEASRAVDVGRWAKGRHVTEVFDQLGLERLLASTPTEELGEFVRHAIGPLVDHDREHDGDLVETLAVWLETRNMAEAARRLHIHYNTMKNRLERVEAVLGPLLADAARSLECEVAIYVAQHYDGPWSAR
jgi:purine catabolism regulator